MKANHLASIMTLEGVSHQADNKVYDAFMEKFRALRLELRDVGIRSKNLGKLIDAVNDQCKVFGMNVNFVLSVQAGSVGNSFSAHMFPPDVDTNHVLINANRKRFYTAKDLTARKDAGKSLTADINLEKPYISGSLSEIPIKIVIGDGFFIRDKFTIGMITAIFLHEVGHGFYYFVYLARQHTANHILESLVSALADNDSKEFKIEVINAVADKLDIPKEKAIVCHELKSGKEIRRALAIAETQTMCSLTNSRMYDAVSFEALADNFVTRLGGATDLAYGLDIFHSSSWAGREKTPSFALTMMNTVAMIAAAPVALPLMALNNLLSPDDLMDEERTYDSQMDRLSRIRRDYINRLKTMDLNSADEKELLVQLDKLSNLLSLYSKAPEETHIVEMMYAKVFQKPKDQRRQKELLQTLEQLADNELFVIASKLKHSK